MTKELKTFEEIKKYLVNLKFHFLFLEEELDIIETALEDYDLLKRSLNRNWVDVINDDKKLKALEIIKEKKVDVGALCELDLELYNKYAKEINGTPTLTKEEYDLLREVLL